MENVAYMGLYIMIIHKVGYQLVMERWLKVVELKVDNMSNVKSQKKTKCVVILYQENEKEWDNMSLYHWIRDDAHHIASKSPLNRHQSIDSSTRRIHTWWANQMWLQVKQGVQKVGVKWGSIRGNKYIWNKRHSWVIVIISTVIEIKEKGKNCKNVTLQVADPLRSIFIYV